MVNFQKIATVNYVGNDFQQIQTVITFQGKPIGKVRESDKPCLIGQAPILNDYVVQIDDPEKLGDTWTSKYGLQPFITTAEEIVKRIDPGALISQFLGNAVMGLIAMRMEIDSMRILGFRHTPKPADDRNCTL